MRDRNQFGFRFGGGSMKLFLACVLFFSGYLAFAQAAATDEKATTAEQKGTEKSASKKTGDIDDEITNARLRAVTGAKTNFSFWSQFNYAGGSILTPFSSQRPQLNSQNNADPTNISGQVSGKYRVTEHDSIIAGVGVQYTPPYTDPIQGNQDQSTTVQSPYVDWNHAVRWGQYQNVFDVAIQKYTLASDLNANLNWSWSVSHQLMREIGASKKLSLGEASSIGQDVYTSAGEGTGSIYLSVSVDPIVEYAFTEKLSFRTVYRLLQLNELSGLHDYWFVPRETESMGLGYAITRDIYIYPNIQWAWNHMTTDFTTFGFSTNINL
jgi:hypothetical protein